RERRRLATRRAEARHATDGSQELALHEVRKAAKRARYAAEAAGPVIGRPARRFADAVSDVQTVLGDHQDTVILRATLRRMGAQAFLAGENGFTFGLLHAREEQRAAQAERDFARAWKSVSRRRINRWLD
ncbi:MAG: CHAD domain-containing protein, partial [Mycobacteriales bacterium]